jgi:cytochrome P450
MGFGDGHHRCPGSYLAIQETDIFLQRLLALETLHIERTPTLTWNELTTGYEVRKFLIALG